MFKLVLNLSTNESRNVVFEGGLAHLRDAVSGGDSRNRVQFQSNQRWVLFCGVEQVGVGEALMGSS